jgi:hypothetical protein
MPTDNTTGNSVGRIKVASGDLSAISILAAFTGIGLICKGRDEGGEISLRALRQSVV